MDDLQNPLGGGEAQLPDPIPRIVIGSCCGNHFFGNEFANGLGVFRSANQLNTETEQFKLKFDFVRRARDAGIETPIVAGIMPVLNAKNIGRMTTLSGAGIPGELAARLSEVEQDDEATTTLGIEWATQQCRFEHRRHVDLGRGHEPCGGDEQR